MLDIVLRRKSEITSLFSTSNSGSSAEDGTILLQIGSVLVYFYRVFPPFALGEAFLDISIDYWDQKIRYGVESSSHDWSTSGKHVAFLLAQSCTFFVMLKLGTERRYSSIKTGRAAPAKSPSFRMVLFAAWKDLCSRLGRSIRIPDALNPNLEETGYGTEYNNAFAEDANSPMEFERQKSEVISTASSPFGSRSGPVGSRSGPFGFRRGRPILAFQNVTKEFKTDKGDTRDRVLGMLGLSFEVNPGECFGLLGTNNCGKSLAISMAVGTVQPDSGEIIFHQRVSPAPALCKEATDDDDRQCSHFEDLILAQSSSSISSLGYCPQENPFTDEMTAYETVAFYLQLHGTTPAHLLPRQTNRLLDKLGLSTYRDVQAGTYSGGNKRKLSVAIALTGDPDLIFLDEPSTGMDIASMQNMWDVINAEKRRRSFVISSHSMNECEAVCDRVGILRGGEMYVCGTITELTQLFECHYELEVILHRDHGTSSSSDHRRIIHLVTQKFPFASVKSRTSHKVVFLFPIQSDAATQHQNSGMGLLAKTFDVLEREKEALRIEDYRLSNPTLEQAFLQAIHGGGGGVEKDKSKSQRYHGDQAERNNITKRSYSCNGPRSQSVVSLMPPHKKNAYMPL